jgi:hypothetical protein
MKLFLTALLLLPLAQAQQKQPVSSMQEDCGVTFRFDTASSGAQAPVNDTGTSTVIDNRQAGCLDWLVTYEPTSAVTVLSLAFQTATDVAGVPTTWSNYPGTLSSGINPNTAVTSGGAVTSATGTAYPFLRMNMTAITGAGVVSGKLYGWKRRPVNVTATVTNAGCVGTIATPCVVVGPTASGSAPTTSPVLVAGIDATNVHTIRTNSFGGQTIGSTSTAALGDGVSNVQVQPALTDNATGALEAGIFRVFPFLYNGSTWDRQFLCTNQVFVNLSASGNAQVIAASGSTNIRVCHIHLSTTAAETIQLTTGTGSNCGTGNAVIDAYQSTTALAIDFSPTAALQAGASNALCVNPSASTALTGVIVYAQF